MTQIYAVHGWAGHAEQWTYWRRLMEQRQWPVQVMERGYGNNAPTQPSWTNEAGPRVVIAHSLGLHFLPSPLLQEATALVLLGCFTAFVPEGRNGRSTQAGLKGMRAALGSEGEGPMLERFFQRAIQPLSPGACPPSPLLKGLSSEGRQRLDDDLVLLETCRTLPRGWPSNARVLVIQGEQDAVVHPSSHQQLLDQLGSQVERVHRGPDWGHALITTEVWELVERWIESL